MHVKYIQQCNIQILLSNICIKHLQHFFETSNIGLQHVAKPGRSTAHVEEEEDGEQGARLEAAKGGRLISPAFTIFFKTKLYLED